MCCGQGGRRMRRRMRDGSCGGMGREGFGHRRRDLATGNVAFDDYREEVLRKLEEEREAFDEYLRDLRRAKDREEFESFLEARRNAPAPEAEEDDTPEAPALDYEGDTPAGSGGARL